MSSIKDLNYQMVTAEAWLSILKHKDNRIWLLVIDEDGGKWVEAEPLSILEPSLSFPGEWNFDEKSHSVEAKTWVVTDAE